MDQKSDYEAENQFDWQLKSTKLLNVYSAFYRSHKEQVCIHEADTGFLLAFADAGLLLKERVKDIYVDASVWCFFFSVFHSPCEKESSGVLVLFMLWPLCAVSTEIPT